MFLAGRRSDTRSPSAGADRCSGRAGSDRDAPLPGTPLWLFSGGASSDLHTPPLSPAHAEDVAGKQLHSLFINAHINQEIQRIQAFENDQICDNLSYHS